jgi:2-polyprenyl-3-methyl-5-hydroxy-6-metoxy-1,4-benzoquinol methylase
MTAKEHYDNHLGNFYSWMAGDFTTKQQEQQAFFNSHNVSPFGNKIAFDLGSGHGFQAISLAKLGYSVMAVDFNTQLLKELRQNRADLPIQSVADDFFSFLKNTSQQAELIVCMGDTLSHLESLKKLKDTIHEISKHLLPQGKVVLSFRDLTLELKGSQRFIPIKSDMDRILTCFLEYHTDHVMVHDIVHENNHGKWVQKISAYPKLRISEKTIVDQLIENKLTVTHSKVIGGMIHLIAINRDKT